MRSKCYLIFRSAPELEKLTHALRTKILNLRKINTVTDVLTEVINNHELAEETRLIKTDCWTAQPAPSKVETLRKRKAAHKLYPSERSESRKIERDQLNREVKRITSECKERAVETKLKRFEKQLDDNETRMAYKIL